MVSDMRTSQASRGTNLDGGRTNPSQPGGPGVGKRTLVQEAEASHGVAAPATPGATGGGQPLPAAFRARMEPAFGADFSSVRVLEDPAAAAMGALAFTRGTDIHVAPGHHDPASQQGQELLAHELTHVVQQPQGRVQAHYFSGFGIGKVTAGTMCNILRDAYNESRTEDDYGAILFHPSSKVPQQHLQNELGLGKTFREIYDESIELVHPSFRISDQTPDQLSWDQWIAGRFPISGQGVMLDTNQMMQLVLAHL
jgi:hypothetical protein